MNMDWRMAKAASPISNLIFDGLRSQGGGRVAAGFLDDLRVSLSPTDRQRLLEDLPLAPSWMHPLLRQIAGAVERPASGGEDRRDEGSSRP
jgi:hypothetical protein